MTSLPIDSHLPTLLQAIRRHGGLILEATPGAGKTTRLPPKLLEITDKKIIVVEPRRLAARLSCERISFERGEKPGEVVGYAMRFESAQSKRTRLLFVTEGVFQRMLVEDPLLSDIGVVVLDEFHERHIHTDLALGFVERLRRTKREDLKLVVMSATMATKPLEELLKLPVVKVGTQSHPLVLEYIDLPDRNLEQQVARAVDQMLKDQRLWGNILVFLTGYQEIMKAYQALQHPTGVQVLPLFSALDPARQREVFQTSKTRKVILATNVAETSLTIPEVSGVIDTGRAKIPALAPWSGLTTLSVKRISKASAIQRAGRAARLGPGLCYRLYSESDFAARDPFLAPEITRLDLSEAYLDILVLGEAFGEQDFLAKLPLLDPPAELLLSKAESLLRGIGAIDQNLRVTDEGRAMARFPLHPRLSAMMVKAKALNALELGIRITALVAEGGVIRGEVNERDRCDIRYQLGLVANYEKDQDLRDMPRAFDLRSYQEVQKTAALLRKKGGIKKASLPKKADELIQSILLTGFYDRLAVFRPAKSKKRPERSAYNLCLGRGGVISSQSVVDQTPFILCLSAMEDLKKRDAAKGTQIQLACEVHPKLVAERDHPLRSEVKGHSFDPKLERVYGVRHIQVGQVQVYEQKGPVFDEDEASEILKKEVLKIWPRVFTDPESLDTFHRRLDLLNEVGILVSIPKWEGEWLEIVLQDICHQKESFDQLRAKTLAQWIDESLSYEDLSFLGEMAPLTIKLPKGRVKPIHYPKDGSPYVTAKISECFGLKETPTIAMGKIPLSFHLQGPHHKTLQMTQDLKGFWQKHYPALRKDLMKKYPKHPWPEEV